MILRIASCGAAFAAPLMAATAALSHPGHSAQIVHGHSHGWEIVAMGVVGTLLAGLVWRLARGGTR